jgi:murein DD-endopeptidase MepM/ murein hydrolase activator NlpD
MSPDPVKMTKRWALMILFLVAGCAPAPKMAVSDSITPTFSPSPTQTPRPLPSATQPLATLTIHLTPTNIPYQVCCPLEEETLTSLRLILANPLKIPPFGHDDGHHGLDFAYYRRGERESIQGIEVYAILPGEVVLTLEDQIPYGYAIMIETPLADLPEALQQELLAGLLEVPQDVVYQGQCPTAVPPLQTDVMSIYHIYAHLEVQPSLQPGESVSCGALLGTVGNTGYSSSPHLHLETRLGPSGAEFSTMAFYDTAYSEEQRITYCLWRMSGHYQLFDPFILFEFNEQDA